MLHVELENILSESEVTERIGSLISQIDSTENIVVVTRENRPAVALVSVHYLEGLTGREVRPAAPSVHSETPQVEAMPMVASEPMQPVNQFPEEVSQPIASLPELPDLPDFPGDEVLTEPAQPTASSLPLTPPPAAPATPAPVLPQIPTFPQQPQPVSPPVPMQPPAGLPDFARQQESGLPPEDLNSSSPLA
jgi:hypothetical protein